ncbi:hypothetical protein VNI00_015564 [Paramarasmius palmivorus]|uniref:Uncharacterized protein n=1 Tax=Paramarasmius palmivorus TaxID=297713 RepID=A0AAW0BLD7_9AGAR
MAFNGSQVNVGGDANNVVYGDQTNNVYKNETAGGAFQHLAQKAAPNACYDSEQRFPPTQSVIEGSPVSRVICLRSAVGIEDPFQHRDQGPLDSWVPAGLGISRPVDLHNTFAAEKYAE